MEQTPEQIAARREQLKKTISQAQAELESLPISEESLKEVVDNIVN